MKRPPRRLLTSPSAVSVVGATDHTPSTGSTCVGPRGERSGPYCGALHRLASLTYIDASKASKHVPCVHNCALLATVQDPEEAGKLRTTAACQLWSSTSSWFLVQGRCSCPTDPTVLPILAEACGRIRIGDPVLLVWSSRQSSLIVRVDECVRKSTGRRPDVPLEPPRQTLAVSKFVDGLVDLVGPEVDRSEVRTAVCRFLLLQASTFGMHLLVVPVPLLLLLLDDLVSKGSHLDRAKRTARR